jgi:hypothetical protein
MICLNSFLSEIATATIILVSSTRGQNIAFVHQRHYS